MTKCKRRKTKGKKMRNKRACTNYDESNKSKRDHNTHTNTQTFFGERYWNEWDTKYEMKFGMCACLCVRETNTLIVVEERKNKRATTRNKRWSGATERIQIVLNVKWVYFSINGIFHRRRCRRLLEALARLWWHYIHNYIDIKTHTDIHSAVAKAGKSVPLVVGEPLLFLYGRICA